jgi:hypothetical protein
MAALLRSGALEKSVDMAADAEQVIDLAKQVQRIRDRNRRRGFNTRPVGPRGRDQGTGAIGEDQDQEQPTLTGRVAEDFEILPLKSMAGPHDPYKLWSFDVGSVSYLPLTASIGS